MNKFSLVECAMHCTAFCLENDSENNRNTDWKSERMSEWANEQASTQPSKRLQYSLCIQYDTHRCMIHVVYMHYADVNENRFSQVWSMSIEQAQLCYRNIFGALSQLTVSIAIFPTYAAAIVAVFQCSCMHHTILWI